MKNLKKPELQSLNSSKSSVRDYSNCSTPLNFDWKRKEIERKKAIPQFRFFEDTNPFFKS
jgi:hypothetical protein